MRLKNLSPEMKEQRRKIVLLLRFKTTEPNKNTLKHLSYRLIS